MESGSWITLTLWTKWSDEVLWPEKNEVRVDKKLKYRIAHHMNQAFR
jgi:hypothetical protein